AACGNGRSAAHFTTTASVGAWSASQRGLESRRNDEPFRRGSRQCPGGVRVDRTVRRNRMIPLMKNAFLREQETKKALAEFISSADKLSRGEQCRRFEDAFAAVQGRRHAVLVNSGSSANLLLLQSLKSVGRLVAGDKVGFSALTWSTNVMPIIQMGFEPVP